MIDISRTIFSTVIPVFTVISLGYLFGFWKKKSDLYTINEFITYIAAPCLVFSSLTDKTIPFSNFYQIFFATLLVATTGILLSLILSRKLANGSPAATLTMSFMNSGNMGLPVALFAFGKEGLAAATIFFVTMSIVHYTAGTAIASGKGQLKDAFLLPLAPAALLGLLVNRFSLTLPSIVERPITLVADSAIPLMLFTLGVRLYGIDRVEKSRSSYLALLRFGIGVLTGLLAVKLFGIKGIAANMMLVQATMPPAVFNFILCEKFGKKPQLAASTIMAGTLLSLVTLPLILYLLYVLNPFQ